MSIVFDKIKYTYEDFNLLVSLSIDHGQFHSILGPSGSGKTTLLRIVTGFLQPDSGRILVDDKDITKAAVSKRNIGMVFQDYSLFPNMNVFNNIAYGLKIRKIENIKVTKRVNELLEITNLKGYGGRKIFELSGGEKQRVALARALAPKPELLLFDEPLSALDIKLRMSLRREIRRIQKETGFTALYVTHDQQEAMSISDKLTVMNNGRIMQTDSPENIYNKPANIFTADFIGILNRAENNFFRPEDCKLCEKNNPDKIELDIIENEYLGGRYTCTGTTKKDEKVKFFSYKKIDVGEKVYIQITKKMEINQP